MKKTGRGAHNKRGLDYFPKMVNFYEDDKIFDLLDEYGPLGVTIYDCILTIVYVNGYFVNLSKDKLSKMVIRKIGNKWIKGQKAVVQVIDYCADLGLLDKDLLLQNIITSVGIQTRYYKIAVKLMKRQLYSKEYWLLDENGEPLLNAPLNRIYSEENRTSSEEINHVSEVDPIKRKENKRNKKNNRPEPYVPDERLNRAIVEFIEYRKGIRKPMADRAVELMIGELGKLSGNVDEQIQILNQSMINGWSGVFPLKSGNQRSKNRFHNYEGDQTDYDEMVWKMMRDGPAKQGTDGSKT